MCSPANLRERIFKREVRHRAVNGAEKNPQRYEDDAAPDGVREHVFEALALPLPTLQRIGKCDADQKVKPGWMVSCRLIPVHCTWL